MREIWLRHKNGGGRVYGESCEIDASSYLGRDCSIGERAEVTRSNIVNGSLVCDDAIVHRAHLNDSSVEGFSRVLGGDRIFLTDSHITGESRIRDSAQLLSITAQDIHVSGSAALLGPWESTARIRIHAGDWYQPPRHHVIEGNGIVCVVSECVPGRYHVGCYCQTYEKWGSSRYRQSLGRHAGWTSAMVEEAFDWFATWNRAKVAA